MSIRLKGFSLSEILVVVGLIGVVAALTLPNVNNDVEERKVIAALRKIYPELATAYDEIVAEHGKPVDWNMPNNASDVDMTAKMAEYMKEKLPVQRDCGFNSGCFTSNNSNRMYKLLLKDGTSLIIESVSKENMLTNIAEHENRHPEDEDCCEGYMVRFIFDVNGESGENRLGYDIFEFKGCYWNGFIASGDLEAGPSSDNPVFGTAWALKAGNRDYLKCPDDLNWNSKRTCK